jgi:hypothetical protein
MDIGVTVTGDRRASLKFEAFPQQAHKSLLERITGLTERLAARVRAAEPVRSGKLRAATQTRIIDRPEFIVGRVEVTADFAKAAALEYGAHATTRVKEHAARLDHVYARLISPMTVIVAAHSRKPAIAEHRFLRGPLADISGEAILEMRQALAEAGEVEP